MKHLSIHAIHKQLQTSITLASLYRMRNRFFDHQSAIRTILTDISHPPDIDTADPARQTIEHLASAFPHAICPVSDFQERFQIDLL